MKYDRTTDFDYDNMQNNEGIFFEGNWFEGYFFLF